MLPDDSIPRCILLIVLIILGGFFAGSETAFSYANRTRMKRKAEDGNPDAQRVVYIVEHFDKALTTLLIGTNVCHVSASVVATSFAVSLLGPIGSVIATIILTLLIFFFSDTIPKNIARVNSDAFAMAVSLPTQALIFILTPVSLVFSGIGALAKKLFSGKAAEPTLTEDEFQTMIEDIEEEGLIQPEESKLICSAIEFSDISAEQVMVPLSDMLAIELDESPASIREKILAEKYSRIPVYLGRPQRVIGILHVKDYLQQALDGKPIKLKTILKTPYFVRPATKLDTLFENLCKRRTHIAIVIDDAGSALGIVTMEDVLEELVGEIYDEDDSCPSSPKGVEA